MKAKVIAKNGVIYRSNLEAIYGGLFESAGISFHFEPKLFETSYGKYLPDFYLPNYDVYIEVKPDKPSELEWKKLQSVSDSVERPAIFLCGRPAKDIFESNYSNNYYEYLTCVFFGVVFPKCKRNFLININRMVDLLGEDFEKLILFEFASKLENILLDLNRPHISDYLLSVLTEQDQKYRYKHHKENPPTRNFKKCALDKEMHKTAISSFLQFLNEMHDFAVIRK